MKKLFYLSICMLFCISCNNTPSTGELTNTPNLEQTKTYAPNYTISPTCIGDLCLGTMVDELKTASHTRMREDEFQYSNSTYIDSVLFIEYVIKNEVLAYSRISTSALNSSTALTTIITKSPKVATSTGVQVGMTFSQLKEYLPRAQFQRLAHQTLGKGQYRERVELENGQGYSLIVINYEEFDRESNIDTLITSISINLQ
ncbi:MAG: hypothetical protein GY810_13050 [Aureispira sp.]|nr:hypothetical protein [Aureispira sp.]